MSGRSGRNGSAAWASDGALASAEWHCPHRATAHDFGQPGGARRRDDDQRHSPAPGLIERPGGPQRIEFGEIGGASSARCTAIAQAITSAGIEPVVSIKIEERMW